MYTWGWVILLYRETWQYSSVLTGKIIEKNPSICVVVDAFAVLRLWVLVLMDAVEYITYIHTYCKL